MANKIRALSGRRTVRPFAIVLPVVVALLLHAASAAYGDVRAQRETAESDAYGDLAKVDSFRIAQVGQAPAAPALKPVPISNRVVRKRKGSNAIAPLRIVTPDSADYLVKIVDLRTNTEEMLIYVGRASTFETKVPLGTYVIKGASGETWYGEKDLFGPATAYFKLVRKDGASEQFAFHREGNRVNGYVVQLVKQVAGNLDTTTIKPDDF